MKKIIIEIKWSEREVEKALEKLDECNILWSVPESMPYNKGDFEAWQNKTYTPIELLNPSKTDVFIIKKWAYTIEEYIKMRKVCDKIDVQLKERNVIIN